MSLSTLKRPEDPCGPLLDSYSIIVAVKREHQQVLESTLLKSPEVRTRCELIIKRDRASAAEAYNAAISEASGDILIFCHSDVYLPERWLDSLSSIVSRLHEVDPNWGVLGAAGITSTGRFGGHLYSTGLRSILGEHFYEPLETASLDELLLVVRRSSGLKFDEGLQGFHLYGTDICMESRKQGMRNYIIPAFCVHNSIGVRYLSRDFWRAYFYMRKKWWSELPLRTCCTTITRSGWPVIHHLLTRTRDHLTFSVNVGTRCSDPELLYRTLVASGHCTGLQ